MVSEPGKSGKPSKRVNEDLELMLFNLNKDIGETTNLADKYSEIVLKLTNYTDEFKKDLKENRRPSGMIKRRK